MGRSILLGMAIQAAITGLLTLIGIMNDVATQQLSAAVIFLLLYNILKPKKIQTL